VYVCLCVAAFISYTRDVGGPHEVHITTQIYNVKRTHLHLLSPHVDPMTALGAERKKSNLTRGSGRTRKKRARRLHRRLRTYYIDF
jgi:hypothetical protein